MEGKKVIDKSINFLFGIKKTTFYLILIFLLAFTLRLIAAINLGVTADDMHHVTYAINFYQAGRLITYEQSAGLWHAFTSIMYDWFGMTQLTSRLTALIFGSLSVLVIYLLTKEFFNDKIALISSFLLAIAPFHIKNTIAEMDVMAMFFVLLSMFLFIKAVKTKKYSNYFMSGLFLGLAIYTKVYPLLFVPSFILYFIYTKQKNKEHSITKENAKKIFLFLLIAAVFTIPILTHNYLLYKDKGITDLHFTTTLKLGIDKSAQYYSWDPFWSHQGFWKALIFGDSTNYGPKEPWLWHALKYIIHGDPINFYLGLAGILFILIYKRRMKEYLIFFAFSILFIFPYLAANILLAKHYLFLEILLIPLGALALSEINLKISQKIYKKPLKLICISLFLFSLFLIGLTSIGVSHFYGKSNIAQMIEFKDENIPSNDLIVADSRMYRGRINWAFQGRPYLEGSDFVNLINSQEQLPGETIPVEVYYFECIPDDCGWGTVKDQPEFNASMESLTDFFKQNGDIVKTILEPNREKPYYPILPIGEKVKIVAIYRMQLNLKSSIIDVANQPKNWWLYDIGYLPKEKQFDYYRTHGIFDELLDKFAHKIVLLALILTFLSPFYVIYLLYKNETVSDNPCVQ